MNEKKAIEKATADAFITLYNDQMGSTYRIIEYSEAPDIQCKDTEGNEFNFEITLTEDRPQDIAALCYRSNHRSLENLKKHLQEVEAGRADPLERVSCLQGNVTEILISRIKKKLSKNYGPNTALVIRSTSPVDWSWDTVREQIESSLDSEHNPYDKGIWIISYSKDKIFRLT